jgi:hypothetical protein
MDKRIKNFRLDTTPSGQYILPEPKNRGIQYLIKGKEPLTIPASDRTPEREAEAANIQTELNRDNKI